MLVESECRNEHIFRITLTNSHLLHEFAHASNSRPKSLIASMSVPYNLVMCALCGKCQRVGSKKSEGKRGERRASMRYLHAFDDRALDGKWRKKAVKAAISLSLCPSDSLNRFYSGGRRLSSSPLMIIIQLPSAGVICRFQDCKSTHKFHVGRK